MSGECNGAVLSGSGLASLSKISILVHNKKKLHTLCHSEERRDEESLRSRRKEERFFTPLCFVQNDVLVALVEKLNTTLRSTSLD
jgi:hypothetical protein